MRLRAPVTSSDGDATHDQLDRISAVGRERLERRRVLLDLGERREHAGERVRRRRGRHVGGVSHRGYPQHSRNTRMSVRPSSATLKSRPAPQRRAACFRGRRRPRIPACRATGPAGAASANRSSATSLREGVPIARAAPAVGLHPTTITYWAWQGRIGNTAYDRFHAAYQDARLERQHRVDELLEDARDRLNGH